MTRGILSRLREWETAAITFFQTDARIVAGQSGGVLVSDRAEVIGLSGFTFTEAGFGLVASSADLIPRIQQLTRGEDPSGLGIRKIPTSGGIRQHQFTLGNFWAEQAYVISEPTGTIVEFAVNGDGDVAFDVYDSFAAELLSVDENQVGGEVGSVTIDYPDPHFLVVWHQAEIPEEFEVRSDRDIVPLSDPDDGRPIATGQSLVGNIDFPGDRDHYLMTARKGETVDIIVSSLLIDPFLLVDYHGATDEQIVIDDDSGGGVFGLDSRVVYRAPHTGNFLLVVEDAYTDAPGGYVLTVGRAESGATLTSTTRDSLWVDEDNASDSAGISHFGLEELRSAFGDLSDTFEEVDPSILSLTIEDLGLEQWFTDVVINSIVDLGELLIAVSGEISGSDRAAVDSELSPERFLYYVMEGFLNEAAADQGILVRDSGLLSVSNVGDIAAGVWFDTTFDGVELKIDIVMFRQEELIGLIYSFYDPDSIPFVPVHEAATLLYQAMIQHQLTQ